MLPAPQRRAMHACVLLVCAQAAQALAPHKLHATTPARATTPALRAPDAARRSVAALLLGGAALAQPLGARAFGLPSVPSVELTNPLTKLTPQIPGVEIGGVEINPFKELDIERPEAPPGAKDMSVEDLLALVRRGDVRSVEFLTPSGDKAVATLADGSLRSVTNPLESKSGNLKLAAKLRDFDVPYTTSFDLSKWSQTAKRTSMRARNQNVLDAEERGREVAAKRAEMDARLATGAEAAPAAAPAP